MRQPVPISDGIRIDCPFIWAASYVTHGDKTTAAHRYLNFFNTEIIFTLFKENTHMQTYLDCIPCFFSQALRAARMSISDDRKIKRFLDDLGGLLKDIPMENTPPETGRIIYQKIREITGLDDPFKTLKADSTRQALKLYPALKQFVEQSEDHLAAAVKVAAVGNLIDFAVHSTIDIETSVHKALQNEFGIWDYNSFKSAVQQAGLILYIADNAGETVFDRILIEQIDSPVIYAVRGRPVINDAVQYDAEQAGIGSIAKILSSGTDAPGAILRTCTPEFRSLFKEVNCVISKGQGNYEALSEETRQIFFLLKIKCRIIADDAGVPVGQLVLRDSLK
jgi:damage-control phosphatase, subfamily I